MLWSPGSSQHMDRKLSQGHTPSRGGGRHSLLLCQCSLGSTSGLSTRSLFVPRIHQRPSLSHRQDSSRMTRHCITLWPAHKRPPQARRVGKQLDMEFHPGKCTTLPVTRSRKPSHHPYPLRGHTLTTVTSTKYLGVTIQNDLNWGEHITNICSKANQILGFPRRNLKISSPSVEKRAYNALVRPRVENAATVWDPSTQKHIAKLEGFHRRGSRFVLSRYHNIYIAGTIGVALTGETQENSACSDALQNQECTSADFPTESPADVPAAP